MTRMLSILVVITAALGCNPDGACETPFLDRADERTCLDAAERSCGLMHGNFTAGKQCSELSSYKLCSGGWYEPDSVMCRDRSKDGPKW